MTTAKPFSHTRYNNNERTRKCVTVVSQWILLPAVFMMIGGGITYVATPFVGITNTLADINLTEKWAEVEDKMTLATELVDDLAQLNLTQRWQQMETKINSFKVPDATLLKIYAEGFADDLLEKLNDTIAEKTTTILDTMAFSTPVSVDDMESLFLVQLDKQKGEFLKVIAPEIYAISTKVESNATLEAFAKSIMKEVETKQAQVLAALTSRSEEIEDNQAKETNRTIEAFTSHTVTVGHDVTITAQSLNEIASRLETILSREPKEPKFFNVGVSKNLPETSALYSTMKFNKLNFVIPMTTGERFIIDALKVTFFSKQDAMNITTQVLTLSCLRDGFTRYRRTTSSRDANEFFGNTVEDTVFETIEIAILGAMNQCMIEMVNAEGESGSQMYKSVTITNAFPDEFSSRVFATRKMISRLNKDRDPTTVEAIREGVTKAILEAVSTVTPVAEEPSAFVPLVTEN